MRYSTIAIRVIAPLAAVALSWTYAGQARADQIFPFFNQRAQAAAPMPSASAPDGNALSEDRQYDQTVAADPDQSDAQLDPRLQRQVGDYASREAPGTIIIDTPHTFLYYVLGNGKAIR